MKIENNFNIEYLQWACQATDYLTAWMIDFNHSILE